MIDSDTVFSHISNKWTSLGVLILNFLEGAYSYVSLDYGWMPTDSVNWLDSRDGPPV